jgi:hypothetical protein
LDQALQLVNISRPSIWNERIRDWNVGDGDTYELFRPQSERCNYALYELIIAVSRYDESRRKKQDTFSNLSLLRDIIYGPDNASSVITRSTTRNINRPIILRLLRKIPIKVAVEPGSQKSGIEIVDERV